MEAAEIIRERTGHAPAIYDIRYIKPLDTQILEEAASKGRILTVEEGCVKGGLFGAVTEYMAEHSHVIPVGGIGIPDMYVAQDRQDSQRHDCGLDVEGIAEKAVRMMEM